MNAESLSLVLSLVSIVTVIWRIATESAQIKASIKDVRDEILYKYDIELEKIKARMDELRYLNNYNKEALNHKSLRFEAEIVNIKRYLEKKFDFNIRRSNRDDGDNGPMSGPL